MTSDRPEFGQPLPKAPGKGKPTQGNRSRCVDNPAGLAVDAADAADADETGLANRSAWAERRRIVYDVFG